jgi:putative transposase
MGPVKQPREFLPRLAPVWYRGTAVVFWTYTVENRATGWLDPCFHSGFREHMMHALVREQLLCPVYTLMPDHVHVMWMGVSAESDQRHASAFFRQRLESLLAPHRWQRQPHDHVLREDERKRGAFASTCHYIAENPVRGALVQSAAHWPYTGCVVPGYPELHPLADDFWAKFWRFYSAAVDRGRIGKL